MNKKSKKRRGRKPRDAQKLQTRDDGGGDEGDDFESSGFFEPADRREDESQNKQDESASASISQNDESGTSENSENSLQKDKEESRELGDGLASSKDEDSSGGVEELPSGVN